MRTTDDILLSLQANGPKCHLELYDRDGGLVIDQSMDVTVRGTVEHARTLLALFLAKPSTTGECFDFKVYWEGTSSEFHTFISLLNEIGGVKHFDKIKERK